MFGQVLVFALLFLPKRAAGLAALSGLAFTGCPPAGAPDRFTLFCFFTEFKSNISDSADVRYHCTVSERRGGVCFCFFLPFLELWGRDQAGKVGRVIPHSALPPVGILLVDDLNDVACLKFEAGLLAGDEVVHVGVIVKLGPHVHLWADRTFHSSLWWVGPR